MKLTGAAMLVSRGMKVLQAAPAAYPCRSAAGFPARGLTFSTAMGQPVGNEFAMNELLQELMQDWAFLYDERGFRFVDSAYYEEVFGNAFLVLQSDGLRVCFEQDKGQRFVEVQPSRGSKNAWYSLDVVRQLITGEPCCRAGMDEDNAQFMKEHLDEICARFVGRNLRKTATQLKDLEHKRAERMFGRAVRRSKTH